MAIKIGKATYVPGTYAKSKPGAAQLAGMYFREWEKKQLGKKAPAVTDKIYPTICFSRKIGVGAVEIADILAQKIGYRVIDREILEQISSQADIREKTVSFFDERYPGKINEFFTFLFGEKSFIKSDYTRHLFSAALSVASLEPTIFVGRGIHLILPRDRVLAVRFISNKAHRVSRLSKILDVPASEVETKLPEIDREQREFFKKVYNMRDATPYEFDMVINCDFIEKPEWAAKIVEKAFQTKFDIK